LKISIAIATYNGGKYINQQLNSLSNQSVIPFEIIICDDNSTDDTIDNIKRFINSTSINTKLFQNKNTLGFSQNFGRALSLCEGDYIFLCDQDDVWFSNKIENMLKVILNHKDKYVFYNDAEFTDSNLFPCGQTKINKHEYYNKNLNGFLQGSCCVIERKFLFQILPIPIEVKAHDIWIGWLARILDVKYINREVLQYYRQHKNNSSDNRLNENLNLRKYKYLINKLSNDNLMSNLNSTFELLSLCKKKVNYINKSNDQLIKQKEIDIAIKNINYELDLIQKRILLKKQNLFYRTFYSGIYLLKGKYSYFNGIYSFLKDIFFNKH